MALRERNIVSEAQIQLKRREFLHKVRSGATLFVMGGLYRVEDASAAGTKDLGPRSETGLQPRSDGRARVPPGQRVIRKLKPMGGQEGDPSKSQFQLRIHGEVKRQETIDFRQLLALDQVDSQADVHCVTGWTVLDARWRGVKLKTLAERAGVLSTARHVIFEAAHGYTANVPIRYALADSCMIVHQLDGRSLARANGSPVRALVPDLYFWKSAKWLVGIRFSRRDRPGYWEKRGYHNRADPWREERYG